MISVFFVNGSDIQNQCRSNDRFIPGEWVEEFKFASHGEVSAFRLGLEKMNDQDWALVESLDQAKEIAQEFFDDYFDQ